MRQYEVIFIIRPDAGEEETAKIITQMEGVVAGAGGKIGKLERVGRRRLAYRVGKYSEGFYVLFAIEGTGDTVKELERRLKVTDGVVKFLTVRVDEDLKRAAKFKALRAKQEARRPKSRPPASPPAPAAAPAAPDAAQG
ncbi:MAG: 30S ribosomal protein S6 [Acidobacteria bacterium]|nr:MAG: 30S ribosomal protein S6 [Acidobacteriota bacterium]